MSLFLNYWKFWWWPLFCCVNVVAWLTEKDEYSFCNTHGIEQCHSIINFNHTLPTAVIKFSSIIIFKVNTTISQCPSIFYPTYKLMASYDDISFVSLLLIVCCNRLKIYQDTISSSNIVSRMVMVPNNAISLNLLVVLLLTITANYFSFVKAVTKTVVIFLVEQQFLCLKKLLFNNKENKQRVVLDLWL